MRAKFLVIIILIIAVVAIVAQMIRIEENIRRKNQVTLRIADLKVPLIEKSSLKQLREYARKAHYTSRCRDEMFEFLRPAVVDAELVQRWSPVYIKGVNLGVAVPGDFPATFSATKEIYCRWLSEIGMMNANAIRTYTILPPEFYDALAHYNFINADKPIYLFQGVWAEEPPNDNFLDPEYGGVFKREIRDLLDVIHGNATLPERPGHASGVYVSDVSAFVAGIILGREWEPTMVFTTNHLSSPGNYLGDFVSAYQASPMEMFLASMMDFTVLYETQVYGWQRPVSFINWLTLDPMLHNSEFILGDASQGFDDDIETIDIRKFHASDLFNPGIFSSYHIYPYYPDFIYLDKKYQNTESGHYKAYLDDLKTTHTGIPLLVAEYGLPNSRGNSHYAPDGFDQGGHSEAQQAEKCAVMTRDIFNSGCAGAIYFEWIDEWFKHNWLVNDYEQPAHRGPLWHNVENAEQNFGIIAFESNNRIIDGNLDDWGSKKSIQTHADPAFFYLSAILPNLDFEKNDLYISFDTHDPDRGDMRLPFSNLECKGIEFLAHFRSKEDASMLVDDSYGGYTDIINNIRPPYTSTANSNGVFLRQRLLANRQQVSLTEDTAHSWVYDRSTLYFGNSSLPQTSNADWFWNPSKETFELRLPWTMINVGDPSSKQVHDDRKGTRICETSTTEGFRIKLYVTDKTGNLIEEFPKRGSLLSSWETWETIQFRERKKLLYDTLQAVFQTLLPHTIDHPEPAIPNAYIAPFRSNAPAALSIIIGSNLSWYPELASRILEKFLLQGAFTVSIPLIGDGATEKIDPNGYRGRRMDKDQLFNLSKKGHEIVFENSEPHLDPREFEALIGLPVRTVAGSKGSALAGRDFISFTSPDILQTGADGIKNGRDLDSLLSLRKGKVTYLRFVRVEPQSSGQGSTSQNDKFEQLIRLARNSGFWIATPEAINDYLESRKAVSLQTETRGNAVFLRIQQDKPLEMPSPLTIIFPSSARKVKVSNSLADGIHEVRDGKVMFEVMPGAQVILEIIER